jgi:hypothetical protein
MGTFGVIVIVFPDALTIAPFRLQRRPLSRLRFRRP